MKTLTRTLSACAVLAAVGAAGAGTVPGQTYTPLAFGPLANPGNGAYYTNVYDISADGTSYVGLLSNGQAAYVYQGTTYIQTGGSAASAITPDGTLAVGGPAGGEPMQWEVANAAGSFIAGELYPNNSGQTVGSFAYGVNRDGSVINVIQGGVRSAVLTESGILQANDAFVAQFPLGAFAGVNRGIAVDAPIQVVLGNSQGVHNTAAYRWNYMTGDVSPLNLPAGATSVTVGGGGSSSKISADASIVGGAARVPSISTVVNVPMYWDANGDGTLIPGVGGRVFGSADAVNYTGTLIGGNLFGPGMPNHAFLYDIANDITYDLNDLYADIIPEGWVLTHTTDISDDGSKIFTRALAPDGSTRFVELTGELIPTPGSAMLLGLAGIAATRRRR